MGLSRQVALGVAILIWLLVLMLLSPLISMLLDPILIPVVDFLPRSPKLTFAIVLLLIVYIEGRWLGIWLRLPLRRVLLWALIAELILQLVRAWLLGWPDYLLMSASPYFREEYAFSGFGVGVLALAAPWLWLAAGALAIAVKAPFYYLALVRGKAGLAAWPAITAPAVSYIFLIALNLLLAMIAQFS